MSEEQDLRDDLGHLFAEVFRDMNTADLNESEERWLAAFREQSQS